MNAFADRDSLKFPLIRKGARVGGSPICWRRCANERAAIADNAIQSQTPNSVGRFLRVRQRTGHTGTSREGGSASFRQTSTPSMQRRFAHPRRKDRANVASPQETTVRTYWQMLQTAENHNTPSCKARSLVAWSKKERSAFPWINCRRRAPACQPDPRIPYP